MAAEVQAMRRRGERVTIRFDADLIELFRVIGALQLAWRHPTLEHETRAAIEHFGAELQLAFDADEAPELARTLEQGWHREFDR